ncbi:hypothetical protein DM02DRAFT_648190 [Periconia macrospinosa]|uniref:Rhodopsin domain-containing protein n=1 Tax=Periconia macrospinosa TaxID=97972 RepID=A0A2V1ECS4_9PLEO|nr:hypothetical protein DM02DRAFT_648190 [Periconia macrospinosa]
MANDLPSLPPKPADGDVNNGTTLNGLFWFFTAFTTIICICRLYSRRYLTRELGLEDAIIVFSLVLLYLQNVTVSIAVHYGLGRHGYYIIVNDGPMSVSNVIKWQVWGEPVAIFGASIPKIAVTMLIIRIVNPHQLVAAFLWTLNITLNLMSVACVVTTFVQCKPTSFYWTRTGDGTCWDPRIVANLALATGSVSAFVDFALALYPVTVLRGLQMPLHRKLGVMILLGFGCFAGVASVIRTTKLSKLGSTEDMTWSFWTLVLWVAIENSIITICACVPFLRPIAKKIGGGSFGSTFRSLFSSENKTGKHTDGLRDNSYPLKQREGKFVKIGGRQIDAYDSRTNLSHGIKATTDVDGDDFKATTISVDGLSERS